MINNQTNFQADLPAGYDGQFDWDVFGDEGCWGNDKIKPMDFDGVVERKGHFIVFETKDDGKDVPEGQKLTLDALARPKSFTVVKLWPKFPPFKKAEIKFAANDPITIWGHDNIIEAVKQWKLDADSETLKSLEKEYLIDVSKVSPFLRKNAIKKNEELFRRMTYGK